MNSIPLIFICLLFFVVSNSYGAVYKCKMPDASFQYSDRPCKKYNLKQEKEVPKFSGKKINIIFENKDIRKAFKEVARHGGYSVSFHRFVTGTIDANYYKKPWDEIIYRMAESQGLSAMVVPGQSIHVTPNQMTISGNKQPITKEKKLARCQQTCTSKYRSCKYLVGALAYETTSSECSSDHYQCQKACRAGFSVY